MDVRRLLVFREIARCGSIAGAARSLGWTQPAVSQHLRALERQAGLPLVVRCPRGVQLTEAGGVLLRHAEAIAARLHAADDELGALAGLRAGTVRLAAFPSAGATLVPAAMSLLHRTHPGIDVRLRQAEPPEALDLLMDGQVDLAIVFAHEGHEPVGPAGLEQTPIGEDPLRLVLPDSHPQAADLPSEVGLRSFAGERWISGCERCTAHLLRACEDAGFVPDVRHSTDDYVVTQALIARGLGVGLLPHLALGAFRHPEVTVAAVAGLRPRRLYLVHHPEADQIPAVGRAVHAVRRSAIGGGPVASTVRDGASFVDHTADQEDDADDPARTDERPAQA
ncbi:LysR substrate-binding domain-containing protein [Actinomadura sp. NEAU-AAG7]|uniref:LysR substrate-binding domain-containing protein n=1 Tax=Actinomadura sp. NEAU-AAG7 TaxID=2839640 RepID=UPI001BE4DCE8|nr:LysR substrate-binding domain-containing protein [Actinomadura sp. NEAU-AAG7]MBT2212064.1 LysR family transcriptional regulator [Actinomadura sp. NEAU-AAG7]